MGRYACLVTKGTYSSPQPMWIQSSVLQELCWRVLNKDVELFLPVGFTDELISAYQFRGFGIHFHDRYSQAAPENYYSLATQEKCIRYFFDITKKYLNHLPKDLFDGKSPVPSGCLGECLNDLIKVVDLLESRLEELPQEMEQEQISGNRKSAKPILNEHSFSFRNITIEKIQLSESTLFVPSNGMMASRWFESVTDRNIEYLLPIAIVHEMRQTKIHFNIFKQYKSEYESILYSHLALKELYEREWTLVSQGVESLFGTQAELLELLELIGLFQKRLFEIQIENKSGLWQPSETPYQIGKPIIDEDFYIL